MCKWWNPASFQLPRCLWHFRRELEKDKGKKINISSVYGSFLLHTSCQLIRRFDIENTLFFFTRFRSLCEIRGELSLCFPFHSPVSPRPNETSLPITEPDKIPDYELVHSSPRDLSRHRFQVLALEGRTGKKREYSENNNNKWKRTFENTLSLILCLLLVLFSDLHQ